MKKYIFGAVVFLGVSAVTFSADLSRYQSVMQLESLSVAQPAIAEVSNLTPFRVYVVATDKGETIEQQYLTDRKTRIIMPSVVEGCTQVCTGAQALADANQGTTFDFPISTRGAQKGVIKITYAKPLMTDRINFDVTADSYMPNSFQLMIDGKRVLNTISGSAAKFPMMSAQNVVIEFEYTQPIRFKEVGVGTVTEEEVNNMIRFVYQPGQKYLLYEGSGIGREAVPTPPINLFSKPKEVELAVKGSEKNPLFKEQVVDVNKDSDTDTVIDLTDNCPMQPNQDQKDGNGNGVGDVCDDYDYDGVPTYRDNCPFISNYNQPDVDRDGLGDACDIEESRFTEKHGWVPWLAFGIVLIAVLGMGYEVIRKIKK